MRVFNACRVIIKRHFGALALYFGIFIALAVVMTAMSGEQYSADFTATKPNYTVINRDGETPLVRGLKSYLAEYGVEVAIEDDREALQDAAFFHATDFIIILPQGFRDALASGRAVAAETVMTTETAKGYYADSLLNQYLNLSRVYLAANPGADEEGLVSSVLHDLSAEATVQMKRFGEGAPVHESFKIYSRMSCYILIVLIILCVSNILMAFRRSDLRMRNMCAPITPRAVSMQQILCGVLVSVAAWVLLTAVGFAIYGSELEGTDGRLIGLILLNTFTITLVALALATLSGAFIRSANSQNAAANFISLGLCFLGGVFVPLEMLGEGMLVVSKFTPTYWYVTALNHICGLTSFGADALTPIWQAILIQFAFAAAFICVSLAVVKHQNQSERSLSIVYTELDA